MKVYEKWAMGGTMVSTLSALAGTWIAAGNNIPGITYGISACLAVMILYPVFKHALQGVYEKNTAPYKQNP